jgi:hypothetical protein
MSTISQVSLERSLQQDCQTLLSLKWKVNLKCVPTCDGQGRCGTTALGMVQQLQRRCSDCEDTVSNGKGEKGTRVLIEGNET